jgi:hypothetical protein
VLLTILLIVSYIFLGAFVCLSGLLFPFPYTPLELFLRFNHTPFTYHTFNQLWESTSHPVHPVFLSIVIIHVVVHAVWRLSFYMIVYIFICLIAINNRRLFFGQNLDPGTCRSRNRLHKVQPVER